MLRLFLFGTPRIEHNGRTVPLRRTKGLALLAYLALTRQAQDRTTLLALLWPEFDDASARNNLRRELSLLKAALDTEILAVDRLQVVWNPQVDLWVDALDFHAQIAVYRGHKHTPSDACAACVEALTSAVRLYGDDFAAGFSLPDSPSFDEWQFFQREGLRQQLAEALQALVHWHSARQEYSTALELARRWLALDPLHEPAQRELMRLYALSGQQSAALRQYEESARLLEKELGVAPEDATIELYRQIRSRAFVRHGDTETRRHGDTETRRHGGLREKVAPSPSPSLPVSRSPSLSACKPPAAVERRVRRPPARAGRSAAAAHRSRLSPADDRRPRGYR
jgi:DNA-binding SARP family transcriptional activator